MKFLKRFFFYLIGVGLGTLMVIFMFGDRDIQCTYFPNDRVLYDMRKKNLEISENAFCQMQCVGIDTSHIAQLMHSGKVNFDQSNPRKEPCGEYTITLETKNAPRFGATVQNCDSTITFLEVFDNEVENCPCGG